MTTTTHHALLAACREVPDDGVRLGAFADWLDEQAGGHSKRAELIRVGLELGKWKGRWIMPDTLTHRSNVSDGKGNVITGAEFHRLIDRQSELIRTHAAAWFGLGLHYTAKATTNESPTGIVRNGLLHTVRGTLRQLVGGDCEPCGPAVRGGMGHVMPDCPDCRGEGTVPGVLAGLRERPVVVEVTDREPFSGGDVSWWWIHANHGSDVDRIPDSLWRSDILSYGWRQSRRARVFPTAAAARAALSRALCELVPEVQS